VTFQTPELLWMQGEQLFMYSTPLDPLLEARPALVQWGSAGSAALRGYVGQWEIGADGRLFLTGFGERTMVRLVEALDVQLQGWVPTTHLPTGAPLNLAFGVAQAPLPDVLRAAAATTDAPLEWFVHDDGDTVVGLTREQRLGWESGIVDLVSDPAGVGRSLPVRSDEPSPVDGVTVHPFGDFGPVAGPGEVYLSVVPGLVGAHDPVAITEPGWPTTSMRLSDRAGGRSARLVHAYSRSRRSPDRLELAEFRLFLKRGHRPAQLADIDPDAGERLHAWWFSGDLRVVPDSDHHREQISAQVMTYRWDQVRFDDEQLLTVSNGIVTASTPAR